jgi:hypothetical protein
VSAGESYEQMVERIVRELAPESEHKTTEPAWDEPVPFPDDPSEGAPTFPIEVFPENAQKVARTVAAHAQAPIDLAASNMLGVTSAGSLGKAKVETQPGLLEEPAVWPAPALPSGERKTKTQREIMRPVYGVQRAQMEAAAEKRHNAEAEALMAEQNLKAAEKREDVTTADLAAAFAELDRAKAALPSSGRIIADDVTPEGLLRLFEDREEVFIAASEGGLLDTLTGLRYGKGLPNLDLLNKSHDGDPHSPVRGSRDHKLIERPLLAMAVSPQPDVLRELVENVTLGRRGTLARFLFSLPSSMIGERAETTEPLDKPAMKWWTEFVQGLFDAVPVGEGIVRMLPQARAVIEEWRRPGTGLEARAAGSGDPRLRAFRSRLHGEVYRLALLLHLLRHGATGFSLFIGEETARGAVKLADYYEAHAEIVYGLLSGDERTRRAKVILSWLEDRVEEERLPRTTVRDVHRAHDRWPVEDVRAALAVLEGRDLYRVVRVQTGGRPSDFVVRNPRICPTKPTKAPLAEAFVGQKPFCRTHLDFAASTAARLLDRQSARPRGCSAASTLSSTA